MTPLISVIVPIYNVEAYLVECIESILNQTYYRIEVILIDDGSTDSSGKICDYIAKKDRRVKVIHKENGGLSSARNAGIKTAIGEYITFIDSDDVVSTNMIKLLVENISDCDMSMCRNIKFKTQIPKIKQETKVKIIRRKKYFKLLLQNPDYVVVWGKLYKRELFKDLRFLEGIVHEDEEFMPRLIAKIKKVSVILQALYFYRIRPNSIMTSGFTPKKLDVIISCKNRIEILKKLGYKSLYRKAEIDYYIHLQRLLKITNCNELENEHEIVEQKMKEWNKYNVKISLLDRKKLGIN